MRDLKSLLSKVHVSDKYIDLFVPVLQPALTLNAIDTDLRLAGFLSQAVYESRFFTHLEEDLYYTTPAVLARVFKVGRDPQLAPTLLRNPQRLANFAYANRGGNRDANSGDGWKYRGRGIFQLTFHDNYQIAGTDLGRPYVDQPDLVAQPSDAVLTAIHYWMKNNLNEAADLKDVGKITGVINGPAKEGLSQRQALFDQLLAA